MPSGGAKLHWNNKLGSFETRINLRVLYSPDSFRFLRGQRLGKLALLILFDRLDVMLKMKLIDLNLLTTEKYKAA